VHVVEYQKRGLPHARDIGQGLSFHAFRSLSLTPRGARPLP